MANRNLLLGGQHLDQRTADQCGQAIGRPGMAERGRRASRRGPLGGRGPGGVRDGVAILNACKRLGIGFTQFVSMGNKADVSGNDLVSYWNDDPETKLVLMYLESFGNPRNFIPTARRFTRKKPLVCVKAGRTAEGGKAAASHTGALAGPDVAADALLEETGTLRVDSVAEMFDVAQALVSQPLPAGGRVAIVTNAGGPAILATDFLVSKGLKLATLSDATKDALRKLLVPEASVAIPTLPARHARMRPGTPSVLSGRNTSGSRNTSSTRR